MSRQKQDVITFKVDAGLMEALQGMPNRSEFIRSALLSALEGVCPLCRGTGVLSVEQREHWRAFEDEHSVKECDECHELYLVCDNKRS